MTSVNLSWTSPFRDSEICLPLGATQYNCIGARELHQSSYLKCGIDLTCNPNTKVFAVETGNVIAVETFFDNKKKPWISSSKAVLVSGPSGVVCYGNIEPEAHVSIGTRIEQGSRLGAVVPFFTKEAKSKNGQSRLRIELYRQHTTKRPKWHCNQASAPKSLLNPMPLLLPLIVTKTTRRNPTLSSKLVGRPS